MLDRQQEKAALNHLLRNVREGVSGALVLRGEPGIGKTALLDYAVTAAADMQVARVVGVESEMELGFAALHQLVLPFAPAFDQLPPPQRDALACAFGLVAGNAPDGFLVGVAALTLLANTATQQPLLCVIDDVQWLDHASAAVLAFVARRLFADRIGMLFAVREPGERRVPLDGLPALPLVGLPPREARELLTSVSGVPVNPRVGERIFAQTQGNPLALVEIGAELTQDELSGASPLPEPLPVGRRLEEGVRRRVRGFPPELQRLLLLAAAEPSGDPDLLWRACTVLGLEPEVADLPGVDRLLTFAPRIKFRHPLIRSAVYHGAAGLSRQRAHKALAAASDPERDRDRRAWHLAAATVGPDEDVAAELERSADRARDRGGWSAAAASLRRAAALTPDEQRRAVRQLRAAHAELVAGSPAVAAELLEQATPALADPGSRAEAMRLQAWTRFQLGERDSIPTLLLDAAEAMKPLDPGRARQILLEAWGTVPYAGEAGVRDLARVSRETPRPVQTAPSPGDMLLDGFALLDTDYPAGVDLLRRAIGVLKESDAADVENLHWMSLGCLAALTLWDDEAMQVVSARAVRSARARGALSALLTRLGYQALAQLMCGQVPLADATLNERRTISAATGNVGGFGCSAVLDLAIVARRGHAGPARELGTTALQEAHERGQAGVAMFVRSALALLQLSLGDSAAALDHAQPVFETDSFLHGTLILPDLIEAATDSGKRKTAAAALTRLTARATASGTPLAMGLLARSRALLAPDGDAERLYDEAIERLGQCQAAGELARTHLLYGEWLRARRRRRDAREHLRTAHGMFDAMGAEAFAERARIGLLASGEQAGAHAPHRRDALTLHESKVALLASQGASNQEIAEELFISASTVAYHLRKVFVKFNITSRAQLANALDAQACDEAEPEVLLRSAA